jgi:SAM-dependent methyltransferase
MTINEKWDERYKSKQVLYPSEEVIKFVAVNFYAAPDRSQVRILDIGCGMGRHVWYLAREGFATDGIDGSETALAFARRRLAAEKLDANLVRGDITRLESAYAPGSFDGAIDIRSLQHNRLAELRASVAAVHRLLKQGGRFFSMLTAEGSLGDGLGDKVEDRGFENIPVGPAAGIGITQFLDQATVRDLFGMYRDVRIEWTSFSLNDQADTFKDWIIHAAK